MWAFSRLKPQYGIIEEFGQLHVSSFKICSVSSYCLLNVLRGELKLLDNIPLLHIFYVRSLSAISDTKLLCVHSVNIEI